MRERRYFKREHGEAGLPGLSYVATGFKTRKGETKNGIQTHYNFIADPELGAMKIAARRIPCSCPGCIAKSKLPIDERYSGPCKDCVLWPIFRLNEEEGLNDFVILSCQPKKDNDEEDTKKAQGEALRGKGQLQAEDIADGGYGVVLVDDDTDYDYYPVIWEGEPYQITEDGPHNVVGEADPLHLRKGEWVCEYNYMNKIDGAPQWYTPCIPPVRGFARMQHVLAPNLILSPISEDCPLPSNMEAARKRECAEKGALKISDDNHDSLMEESDRRATVEYTEVEFVERCDDLNENDGEQEGEEDDLYESEEEDAD